MKELIKSLFLIIAIILTACAGPEENIFPEEVTSRDVFEGEPLALEISEDEVYLCEILTAPDGSSAFIYTMMGGEVYFIPDLPGEYTIKMPLLEKGQKNQTGEIIIRVWEKKVKNLLIYYGYPTGINLSSSSPNPVETAALEFSRHDYVVLGSGIENPVHDAHQGTRDILGHPLSKKTQFFGYIDLGVTTNNYTIDQIKERVLRWQSMGIDGIFLDDYGYDFGVTRKRQNDTVGYIHDQGLPVIANAWEPDDVFGSLQVAAYNPNQLAPLLKKNDFFFYESYQIINGQYETSSEWRKKMNLLKNYKSQYDFKVLAVTTSPGEYNQQKHHYAWYSAFMDEMEALGWGEPNFATNSTNPFREPPAAAFDLTLTSNIRKEGSLFIRDTNKGKLKINPISHTWEL